MFLLDTNLFSQLRKVRAGKAEVVLDPRNPFALRSLGQLLLMQRQSEGALPHLRAAATVAPEAPINLFTYAQGLLAGARGRVPRRRGSSTAAAGPAAGPVGGAGGENQGLSSVSWWA